MLSSYHPFSFCLFFSDSFFTAISPHLRFLFPLHQQPIPSAPRGIYEGVRNRTGVYTKQELKEDEGQDEGVHVEQRVQV